MYTSANHQSKVNLRGYMYMYMRNNTKAVISSSANLWHTKHCPGWPLIFKKFWQTTSSPNLCMQTNLQWCLICCNLDQKCNCGHFCVQFTLYYLVFLAKKHSLLHVYKIIRPVKVVSPNKFQIVLKQYRLNYYSPCDNKSRCTLHTKLQTFF